MTVMLLIGISTEPNIFKQDISHLYIFAYYPDKQNVCNNSNKQINLIFFFLVCHTEKAI